MASTPSVHVIDGTEMRGKAGLEMEALAKATTVKSARLGFDARLSSEQTANSRYSLSVLPSTHPEPDPRARS